MDTLRIIAMGVLAIAPPLGMVFAVADGHVPHGTVRGMSRATAGSALLAALWLLGDVAQTEQTLHQPIFAWLKLPGLTVSLSISCDGFALLLLALVSAVLLLTLSRWPERASLSWLMLAWWGVTAVLMADNLGQVFLGWTWSAWASSELSRPRGKTETSRGPFRPIWLVQRVTDVALLTGVGLIWMHFGGSFDFWNWTEESLLGLRSEMLESISLCVLIGVIGRCAQVPLTVWLETEAGFAARAGRSMMRLSDEMIGLWNVPDGHHVAERLQADLANRWHADQDDSIPAPVLAWWLCAAFLPVGFYVLWRCAPLLEAAEHTRSLLVAVGVFTVLTTSASAATQNHWSGVLSQLAVGQCGWSLLAFGMGGVAASVCGLWSLVWQSVFVALLLVSGAGQRTGPRGWPLAVVVCLVSGLWGRQGIADLLWQQAWPVSLAGVDRVSMDGSEDSFVLGASSSHLLPLLLGVLCLSEVLAGFAMFRAWFLAQRIRQSAALVSADQNSVNDTADQWCGWALIGIAVAAGLLSNDDLVVTAEWLGLRNYGRSSLVPNVSPALFGVSFLWPLPVVGAVLAWWMYSRPSSLPERLAVALGPFTRLSRNRFYADDLYFLLIVHPATTLCRWLAWLDERVWSRGRVTIRQAIARWAGESQACLTEDSPPIFALATGGSVTVLALVLLWLRSS